MKTPSTRIKFTALLVSAVLGAGMSTTDAQANNHLQSLPGSQFEIDTNADLIVNGGLTLDWANVQDDAKYSEQDDLPTGKNDDSFAGGTKEDTQGPNTTTGSIPNNKSDLLKFGVFQEGVNFLHLYWARVQDPSGTTLMDFEFNAGDQGTTNGFPNRIAGDLLVEYKLAQGGTNAQLFLYEWLTAAAQGSCESSNKYPCWGNKMDLTAAGIATGSVNTSAADASSIGLDSLSPYTFGEASIDLSQIFPEGECQSFGSAYLKSRSSDSFTAQMKDFIRPMDVNISNCATITIIKQDDADPPNALAGAVFKLYKDNGNTAGQFDGGDELVTTCTTLSDGICNFFNQQAGDYCVVETTPPPGHSLPAPPDDEWCFTLVADLEQERTFTNPRKPAKVNITKQDDTGAILGDGWQFTLYDNSDGNGVLDTGETAGSCTTVAGTCTIDNILPPGDYCVEETVNPQPGLYGGAAPQCFSLVLDQTRSLTFTNPRLSGAIKVIKTIKHKSAVGGSRPHAGVSFTVNGVTKATDANGEACFDGLLLSGLAGVGDYAVTEIVPAGANYVPEGNTTKQVTVDNVAKCNDSPYVGETVNFVNLPLTDITIIVDSLIDGATQTNIKCTNSGGTATNTDDTGFDFSVSLPKRAPGVYTCIIDVDP